MPDPTFVTDGAWGTGSGVPHTANEADQLVYDLHLRIEYLEDNPVQPNQITNVTQSGGVVTFWMADSTTFDVSLPVVIVGADGGAPVGDNVEGIDVTDGGTFTPVFADLGKWFTCIDGDVSVVLDTVEPDAPLGSQLHFYSQIATGGVVTIEESTDITIEVKAGRLPAIEPGGVMTVKKRDAGIWVVFGDLADEDVTS